MSTSLPRRALVAVRWMLVLMAAVLALALAAPPASAGPGRDKTPDTTPNDHPSGRDRTASAGGSGTQGRSSSDPDGMTNGGADKPGGSGGYDEDRDGNNGCGNDDDFEDDNNGWCGRKPERERSAVDGAGTHIADAHPEDTSTGDTSTGGTDTTDTTGDTDAGPADTDLTGDTDAGSADTVASPLVESALTVREQSLVRAATVADAASTDVTAAGAGVEVLGITVERDTAAGPDAAGAGTDVAAATADTDRAAGGSAAPGAAVLAAPGRSGFLAATGFHLMALVFLGVALVAAGVMTVTASRRRAVR